MSQALVTANLPVPSVVGSLDAYIFGGASDSGAQPGRRTGTVAPIPAGE